MADTSQDIYNRARNIFKVVFQQERTAGDYEVNELQDNILGFFQDLRDNVGGLGPVGDGFRVESTGNANELRVRKGVFLTPDGRILLLENDFTVTGLTVSPGGRVDNIYMEVLDIERDESTFPDIINPTDGEVLAVRLVQEFEILFSEGSVPTPPGSLAVEHVDLARLTRASASPIIVAGEIEDRRTSYGRTFVRDQDSGSGLVTDGGGLTVDVENVDGDVDGLAYSIAAGSLILPNDSTSFVYVDETGTLVNSTTRPYGAVVELAVVTTVAGAVDSILDRRRFFPSGLLSSTLGNIRAESGASQFDLSIDAGGTTVSISSSNLEDGTFFPGTSGLGGFTAGFTNYIYWDVGGAALAVNNTGFLTEDSIPLWTVVADGAGLLGGAVDRRPWFSHVQPPIGAGVPVPLSGLTFLPLPGGSTKILEEAVPATVSGNIDVHSVDFTSVAASVGGGKTPRVDPIAIPANASHMVVRVALDLEGTPAAAAGAFVGAYDSSLTSGVGNIANDPNEFVALWSTTSEPNQIHEGDEYGFDSAVSNEAGNHHYATHLVEINDPAVVGGDLSVVIYNQGAASVSGSVRALLDGWLIEDEGTLIETALQGKTIVPVPKSQKDLGIIYLFSGPGAAGGDVAGSVDLATAGAGPRTVPSNATHALIRGGFGDMNAQFGTSTITYTLYVAESGTALPFGGEAIATVNADGNAAGEGSSTDLGYAIVPIKSTPPHIDWYLDYTGPGGATFLLAALAIDGWLVDDSAVVVPGPAVHAFSAFTSPSASQVVPANPGGLEAGYVVVDFDAEKYDPDAAFDLTANSFTAPSDGKYFFTGALTMDAVPAGDVITALIWKNPDPTPGLSPGEEIFLGTASSCAAPGKRLGTSATAVIDLLAGDVVVFAVTHDSGGPLSIVSPGIGVDSEATGARFEGYRIGS